MPILSKVSLYNFNFKTGSFNLRFSLKIQMIGSKKNPNVISSCYSESETFRGNTVLLPYSLTGKVDWRACFWETINYFETVKAQNYNKGVHYQEQAQSMVFNWKPWTVPVLGNGPLYYSFELWRFQNSWWFPKSKLFNPLFLSGNKEVVPYFPEKFPILNNN